MQDYHIIRRVGKGVSARLKHYVLRASNNRDAKRRAGLITGVTVVYKVGKQPEDVEIIKRFDAEEK